MVQHGVADAAVGQDALDGDAGRSLGVQVDLDLSADAHKLGVGHDVTQHTDVHGRVAHPATASAASTSGNAAKR